MLRTLTATFAVMAAATIAVGCGGAGPAPEARARPNIIVVITDDQGYGDVGVHGNPEIRTPNLDQLHGQSVRLTDYHVDPTCAPTRSALLTGRYSSRTGVWHTIQGRSIVHRDETMISNLLGDSGYATAMFGKWHLGDNYPYRPEDRGFQRVVRHGGGGVQQLPDYWGNDYFDATYWADGVPPKYEGYCTDVWFNEALSFIEKNRDKPFFVYLATNAPHGPFLVEEKYSKPYADSGVPDPMDKFYGMIENIDDNMGRLVAKLDELGLADNTALIFTTDNGTAAGAGSRYEKSDADWKGFNDGMRGQKGSEYEGGHRVPFFVRWPNGGLGEPRDVDALTAHIDVLPTLAEIGETGLPADLDLDGKSLLGLFRSEGEWPERTLAVHSQRIELPEKWRKSAVMTEQWRLINGEELYDVQADPSQQHDVAGDQPLVVTQLRESYNAWWDHISDRFEDYVRIPVGDDGENPARITAHDWHPEPANVGVPWNQVLITQPKPWNGVWMIDVVQAGTYELTLYRYDEPAGEPLGAKTARARIGDVEAEAAVEQAATAVTLTLELPAGPAEMRTWLEGGSEPDRGAGAVYVKRL